MQHAGVGRMLSEQLCRTACRSSIAAGAMPNLRVALKQPATCCAVSCRDVLAAHASPDTMFNSPAPALRDLTEFYRTELDTQTIQVGLSACDVPTQFSHVGPAGSSWQQCCRAITVGRQTVCRTVRIVGTEGGCADLVPCAAAWCCSLCLGLATTPSQSSAC
jgi:hypothetical protein